jgi:hypothetical protein
METENEIHSDSVHTTNVHSQLEQFCLLAKGVKGAVIEFTKTFWLKKCPQSALLRISGMSRADQTGPGDTKCARVR